MSKRKLYLGLAAIVITLWAAGSIYLGSAAARGDCDAITSLDILSIGGLRRSGWSSDSATTTGQLFKICRVANIDTSQEEGYVNNFWLHQAIAELQIAYQLIPSREDKLAFAVTTEMADEGNVARAEAMRHILLRPVFLLNTPARDVTFLSPRQKRLPRSAVFPFLLLGSPDYDTLNSLLLERLMDAVSEDLHYEAGFVLFAIAQSQRNPRFSESRTLLENYLADMAGDSPQGFAAELCRHPAPYVGYPSISKSPAKGLVYDPVPDDIELYRASRPLPKQIDAFNSRRYSYDVGYIQHVVCVDLNYVRNGKCTYQPRGTFPAYNVDVSVSIRDANTSEELGSKNYQFKPDCPWSIGYDPRQGPGDRHYPAIFNFELVHNDVEALLGTE